MSCDISYSQLLWLNRHDNVEIDGEYGETDITNMSFEQLRPYHHLTKPSGKVVLDIGVGEGHLVKELSVDNEVHGCDISPTALAAVDKWCSGTWLTSDLNRSPAVDLAICNLVFQHANTDEIIRIIKSVRLKPGGVMSFQFACLNENSVLSPRLIVGLNSASIYFYSVGVMEQLVEMAGKRVIKTYGPYWFDPPFSFDWFIFHIEGEMDERS